MQDEHDDESGGLRVYLQRSGCTDELRRHYGSGSEADVGAVNFLSPPHLGMMGIPSLPFTGSPTVLLALTMDARRYHRANR